MERRFLGSEVRVSDDGGEVSGYAAVYYDGTPETEYRLREDVVERVMPGAFDGVLDGGADVKALWNHNEDLILGRVKSRTLTLQTDKRGLRYTIRTGDTSIARDVREHIRRGDAGGSSFSFRPVDPGGDRWRREGEINVRELREVDLFDVSPVIDPAYRGATVAARSVGDPAEAIESLERHLAEKKTLELPCGVADRRTAERVERAIAAHRKRGDVVAYRSMENVESRRCGERLCGNWCVDPRWMAEAAAAVKAGLWPMVRANGDEDEDERPYLVRDGIAEVEICGSMQKGRSSFGGCSTVRARQLLRQAAEDEEVHGILLRIDSPGGTVAGTEELAHEVRRARLAKPIHAHAEDLCASAAYWVGSQAGRVTASPLTEVGSIGVICRVLDLSGHYALKGIRVHVVTTGDRKGDFSPGVPVTDESLQVLRGELETVHQHFVRAVCGGRQLDPDTVSGWADGRCFDADAALEMGMIDAVEREDEALESLRAAAAEGAERAARRREISERAAHVERDSARRWLRSLPRGR